MKLRSYQQSIFDQCIGSDKNLLVQLDTGAGKTPIIARLAEYFVRCVVVCHRNILIKQMSEKLAMCGISHRLIAANQTKKICANNNIKKTGTHHLDPASTIIVVSIDSFISQSKRNKDSFNAMLGSTIIIDEAHHFAKDNKWDKLQSTIAGRCLGFSATPCRADGQPLMKYFEGFFDELIQAQGYETNGTERLIGEGYLSEYCAYVAEPKFYGQNEGGEQELHLAMSAYKAYAKYAQKRQTIVICPRIDNAIHCAHRFREEGVSADVIHSKLPQYQIQTILDAFASKALRVLIAVDMINEGFDVPDADVLILSRVVSSFGLYRQLCGRVLRPRAGKDAVIIDINGLSVARHGLPSDPVDWQERQGQIRRKDLAVCTACHAFFKAVLYYCPHCGEPHDIKKRADWGCSFLDEHFFDADMIIKARIILKKQALEEQRAKERQAHEAAKRERYFDFVFAGKADTLASKRCAYFFQAMTKELKDALTPIEYNNYFEKIGSPCDILFYAQAINADFEKNKREQCLKLYHKSKS